MPKINMKSVLLIGAGVLAVLLATGVSIVSILPLVFLIACPVMMMFMHGGHGAAHGNGHSNEHGNGHGSSGQSSSNLPDR